jgi:arylsulfatase A
MNRRDFIRTSLAGAALAALPRWGAAEEPASQPAGIAKRPPNIIFILADDLGYDLLSCYGSDQFKTPNIDALAAGGTRFRYCHTSPVCGPSRCQFTTGMYPFRSSHVENSAHVKTIDPAPLPSVAKVLKGAGYATGLCGKWHMGGTPQSWGFAEQDKTPGQRYWVSSTLYKPDLMHDWSVDFIQRHAARPFFLWYSLHVPHANLSYTPDSTPETVSQSKEGDRTKRKALDRTIMADNIAYMDKLIGKLMDELDRLKLRQNTLVIFAGDNGTAGFGAGTIGGRKLVGVKRHLQDGGATVPMIACWPGTMPAGKVCDDLVGFEDFLPTFAELAGAPLPKDKVLDGVSFAPQLRGQKGTPREWIFTQYQDQWFVRDQRRKLYNDGRLVDTSDYPFTEKELPADAEPDLRRKFQKIADDLGVDKVMKAHPEWWK